MLVAPDIDRVDQLPLVVEQRDRADAIILDHHGDDGVIAPAKADRPRIPVEQFDRVPTLDP